MGITNIKRPWPPENHRNIVDMYEVIGKVNSTNIIQIVVLFNAGHGSVHDASRVASACYENIEIVKNSFIGQYPVGSENYRVHISRADRVVDKSTKSDPDVPPNNPHYDTIAVGTYCSEDQHK